MGFQLKDGFNSVDKNLSSILVLFLRDFLDDFFITIIERRFQDLLIMATRRTEKRQQVWSQSLFIFRFTD